MKGKLDGWRDWKPLFGGAVDILKGVKQASVVFGVVSLAFSGLASADTCEIKVNVGEPVRSISITLEREGSVSSSNFQSACVFPWNACLAEAKAAQRAKGPCVFNFEDMRATAKPLQYCLMERGFDYHSEYIELAHAICHGR